MIQKKVCMVGVFGTGKTSLVQRYVHSLFSSKYHSTVGVKIDRKQVRVGETDVNLLLWDVEGRTAEVTAPAELDGLDRIALHPWAPGERDKSINAFRRVVDLGEQNHVVLAVGLRAARARRVRKVELL